MKHTTFTCDHCHSTNVEGLAAYKLTITRPPEWSGQAAIAGANFMMPSPLDALTAAHTDVPPFEERTYELCKACDAKVKSGGINPLTIQTPSEPRS